MATARSDADPADHGPERDGWDAFLDHPAWWAWPLAAALTVLGPPGIPAAPIAVRWYTLPALGLVLLGCLPSLGGWRAHGPLPRPRLLPRRLLVALTVAILAASVGLRLWRLTEWPPVGIGFEEFELAGRANIEGGPIDRFVQMYAVPVEHTLTAYAMSLSFGAFGTGFFQMRLPFMIVGVCCPFLFFLLCRRLVAWEPALFALALFTVSWWQIAGSRPADEIFFPLWVELAAMWLLLRFEDGAEAWVGFALGLSSGLLIYEYSAYHLVAPLVLAYLVGRGAVGALRILRAREPSPQRRRRLLDAARRYAPGVVALLLVWAILARLQLLRDVRLGMGSWLLEGIRRHGTNGVLGKLHGETEFWSFARVRVGDTLRAFYMSGVNANDFFFGLGDYPAFDPVTAAAMAIGAVLCIVTPWRRFHILVPLWAALLVLGASLLPGNVNTQRYYVALPIFYTLIALGAGVLWEVLRWRAARGLLVAVFAVAAATAAQVNIYRVYWQLIPDQQRRLAWIWPRTEIARWVRERPRDEPICIVANEEDPGITGPNPLRRDWIWTVKGWNTRLAATIEDCLPAPTGPPPPRYIVFALRESPADLAGIVRGAYPEMRELAPIEVPHHQFIARTFSVAPPH